jgi:hypothetical protein
MSVEKQFHHQCVRILVRKRFKIMCENLKPTSMTSNNFVALTPKFQDHFGEYLKYVLIHMYDRDHNEMIFFYFQS